MTYSNHHFIRLLNEASQDLVALVAIFPASVAHASVACRVAHGVVKQGRRAAGAGWPRRTRTEVTIVSGQGIWSDVAITPVELACLVIAIRVAMPVARPALKAARSAIVA